MMRLLKTAIVTLIAAAISLPAWGGGAGPMTTGFTYQGMLKINGSPYSGTADLHFRLYDAVAGGTQVGGVQLPFSNVIVNGGTFTVGMDWGSLVFNGGVRWLEIDVRTPAGSAGSFTTMSPRQQLTAVPYALFALNANTPFTYNGANATFNNGGFVGIGTSNPIGRMHVRSAASGGSAIPGSTLVLESNVNQYLSMINTNSAESGILFGRPGSSNPVASGGIVYNNASVLDGLDFRTGGNQTRMVITGNGNVGIGTSTPNAGLNVLRNAPWMDAVQAVNAAPMGTGEGSGILGATYQSNHYAAGVRGVNYNGNGTGVIGHGSAQGPTVLGGGSGGAFTGYGTGVFAKSGSPGAGEGLLAEKNGNFVRVAYWNGSTMYKVHGAGAVSTVVRDGADRPITMFAPESPEVLFNDYGRGALVNGFAHIELDPDFARNVMISEEHPLRVFIQLEDNETCEGVIVKNKTASGFDVVELRGGHSNTPFQYQITCNRADEVLPGGRVSRYADVRFPAAPEPAVTLTAEPDAVAKP